MENKTVLITGAAGKLGSQLADVYKEKGYNLILADKVDIKRDDAIIFKVNFNKKELLPFFEDIVKLKIDEIIYCAIDSRVSSTVYDIMEIMWTNLTVPIMMTSYLISFNQELKSIFINSNAGVSTHSGALEYCASKHGLKGYADALKQSGHDVISFYPNHIVDARKLAELIFMEAHYNDK